MGTAFDWICLTNISVSDTGAVTYNLNFDANKVAGILGLNCKTLSDNEWVMYKGSNDQNGVYFSKTITNNIETLIIKPYKDGAVINMNIASKRGNQSNLLMLTYKVGTSTVFGIKNQTEEDQMQVCIGEYIGNSSGYGYCFARTTNIMFPFNTLLDTGEWEQCNLQNIINNESIISMAPLVHSASNVIFPHIYAAVCFKSTQYSYLVNMNGLTCVSLYTTTTSMSRCLAEI